MYTPAHFKEERLDILHAAIARIGLATLVTRGDAGLEASQLPMIVDPAAAPLGVLSGHMARANPLWKRAGSEALAVFLGPHAYISPSWYPSKTETGKVVPTWNYLAVHATGTIEFFDDPAQLRAQVEQLTRTHETGREPVWAVGDAPDAYIAQLLRAIVGFRLTITRLEGQWKMSQNKSATELDGVVQGLARDGADDILAIMKP
jgi:transcriptional regulator